MAQQVATKNTSGSTKIWSVSRNSDPIFLKITQYHLLVIFWRFWPKNIFGPQLRPPKWRFLHFHDGSKNEPQWSDFVANHRKWSLWISLSMYQKIFSLVATGGPAGGHEKYIRKNSNMVCEWQFWADFSRNHWVSSSSDILTILTKKYFWAAFAALKMTISPFSTWLK